MLCHDPRISNNPKDKVETENPALQLAELTRKCFPDLDIDWEHVTKYADYCDMPVLPKD